MKYFLKHYGFLIALMLSVYTFSQSKVKDYIIEGNEYYAKGKYNNAEYAYKRAALEDPTSVKANFNLGNALYQQKRYQESITHYNKSAEIANTKQEKHSAFHNAGNAYLEEKEYEKAVESFKNALRNDPKDEQTRYNLAYAKKMLEQQKQKDGNQSKNKSKDQNKEKENKENKDNKSQDKNQQNNPQQNKDNNQEQQNKSDQSEKDNAGGSPKNGGENGNQDGKGNQPNTEISQGSKGKYGAEKDNAPNGVGDGMLKALQEQEARTQRRIIQQKSDQKKSKTAKDW